MLRIAPHSIEGTMLEINQPSCSTSLETSDASQPGRSWISCITHVTQQKIVFYIHISSYVTNLFSSMHMLSELF